MTIFLRISKSALRPRESSCTSRNQLRTKTAPVTATTVGQSSGNLHHDAYVVRGWFALLR